MSAGGKFVPDPSWPTILELATELWGQPTDWSHDRNEVRFGSKGSKSLRLREMVWKDHESGAGGGYVEMWRLARHGAPLPPRDIARPKPKPSPRGEVPPWENIGVIYQYHNADGDLVLDVVRTRTGQPRFVQRTPDGFRVNGEPKWRWSVKHIPGHDCLLYRLPGLRASGEETIWITEGEKDADRLHDEGLIATTNIGGAGKWRDEYAEEFRSKPCVVLQDNDQAGRDHTATVARSLVGVAASVKVLALSGLPEKGDVSDFLDDNGTIEELERLAREAPEYRPPDDPTTKPVLRLRYGFDATAAQPLGTVVEGLLHAGSVTLIYGPPKSGKSFLATDLALTVADKQAKEWMGHVIVRPGPMLVVACEGHAGFWKRTKAAAKERGWDRDTFPKGFILATGRPMLIRIDAHGMHYAPDPSSILEALEDAKRHGLDPVGIVIDTVFRSFGAGNVNASPDMNVYLACVAVLTDLAYAVALVHHEIKSGGTPAGSVSLIGGSDNIIHVWRETETGERRLWQLEMAKDDAETEPRAFTLEVVQVGLDPDGRKASSCVVRDAGSAPDASAKKKRGRPPAEGSSEAVLADLIHDKLCDLLADPREGQSVTLYPETAPIRAVSRTRLRNTINHAGILEPVEDEADRKRVTNSNRAKANRAINRLIRRKKVAANEQWIGLA